MCLTMQYIPKLLISTSYSKSVKIRLCSNGYLQTCCRLLKQFVSSLWIKRLDNQLAASMLTTCYHQAKQQAIAAKQQSCNRLNAFLDVSVGNERISPEISQVQ